MIPIDITEDANHTGADRLIGFAIKETGSAAAVIELRKLNVTGQVIWPINLAADQSAGIFFPKAIASEGGVYVKVVSGAISGVLFVE